MFLHLREHPSQCQKYAMAVEPLPQIHYNLLICKDPAMSESTVTAKGQTTVPAEVRDCIGACAGTRLVWHPLPDGSVLVRAKSKSILDLAGTMKPPSGKHLRTADMDPWR